MIQLRYGPAAHFCDGTSVKLWWQGSSAEKALLFKIKVCMLIIRLIRYFDQLRYGCNNPQCTTPACFSCHKRVSRAPPRPLSPLSARTLAFFLASQDDPEGDLCPHPLLRNDANSKSPSIFSNEPAGSATESLEASVQGNQLNIDKTAPGKEAARYILNVHAPAFKPLTSNPGLQVADVGKDKPNALGEGVRPASTTLDDTDSANNGSKEQARRDFKSITQSLFDASYTRFLQMKKIPEWMLQREAWFGTFSNAKLEEDREPVEGPPINNATKTLPHINNLEGQRKAEPLLSNEHGLGTRTDLQYNPKQISNSLPITSAVPNTSNAYPETEDRKDIIDESHDTRLQPKKQSNKTDLRTSTQDEDTEKLQDTVSTLTTQPLWPQTLSHFSPENIASLLDMVQACNRSDHIDQRFSEFMGRTTTPTPIRSYLSFDVLNSQMSMAFTTQSIAYVLSNTPALLRSFRSRDGTTLDLLVIVESFRNLKTLDYEPHKIIPCLAINTSALYPDAVLKSRSPVLKARRSAKGVEANRLSRQGVGSPCVTLRDTLDNDEAAHIIKIAFAALVSALPLLKPNLWDAVRLLRASGFVAPDWYMDGKVLNVTVLCEVMDALEDENSIALATKLVKVIAARNCADKMSTSSCQSRTDTEKSPSRYSNIIYSVYLEVVSLLVAYRVNVDADSTEEDVEMEKCAISATAAIVEWLRTVILKHWDGQPKVSRWGPVGGAIEQMSFLCKRKIKPRSF